MSQVKKPRHEQLTSINAKVARNINRAIVLNLIRERQPVSRASISRATGLNKSTVSNIVASLLAEDLVAEQIDQNREVGRNPLNLRVRTGKHFVGAIYFESTKTELAIVDISGTIKNRIELESETDQPY